MKILIFHTGSLGGALFSVSALWAIREHFRDAHIALLSDAKVGRKDLQPRVILDGPVLGDDHIGKSYEFCEY